MCVCMGMPYAALSHVHVDVEVRCTHGLTEISFVGAKANRRNLTSTLNMSTYSYHSMNQSLKTLNDFSLPVK